MSTWVVHHQDALWPGLLAVGATARIAELLWARRLAACARGRGVRPAAEPIFGAMVVLHTLPFWLAPLEVWGLGRPFVPAVFVACVAALAGLFALRLWTLWSLGSSWNVRLVAPERVVVRGPYRWVRHPNYAIVVAELALLPLAHLAWASAALIAALNAVVLGVRIPAEERLLGRVPGYAEAMRGKARFIPGVL